MTPELLVLTLALLLQIGQFVLLSVGANLQLGTRYTSSARDEPRALTGTPGRLQRALNNHFEALLLFAPAAIIVTLSEQSTAVTAACAWIYLVARVFYVPAYALGWVPWRSMIWGVGFLATLAMLLAVLV